MCIYLTLGVIVNHGRGLDVMTWLRRTLGVECTEAYRVEVIDSVILNCLLYCIE